MALSGLYSFDMTADELIRMSLIPIGGGRLNGEELREAILKLNLVLRHILNAGHPLADICQYTEPMITGQQEYNLETHIIDVHHAVMETLSSKTEIGINRVSYAEFNSIPNKTRTGRPTTYMTERNPGFVTIRVWPLPDRSYNMNMYVFIKPDDIKKYSDHVRFQPRYYPAVIAGLTLEMARSRMLPIEKLGELKNDFMFKLNEAQFEDRERVSFHVTPQLNLR